MLIHLSERLNVVKKYFTMGSWGINNQYFFQNILMRQVYKLDS
jgi:hypothetical protein